MATQLTCHSLAVFQVIQSCRGMLINLFSGIIVIRVGNISTEKAGMVMYQEKQKILDFSLAPKSLLFLVDL